MCRKDAGWSCIWYAAFVFIQGKPGGYAHPICLLQTVARRRYLGCVFCSLMYRYIEVQAKACLQADRLGERKTFSRTTWKLFPINIVYRSNLKVEKKGGTKL